MPSLTLLRTDNLVSAWVPDDVIDMSFNIFFITAKLALFLAQQVSKGLFWKKENIKMNYLCELNQNVLDINV